MKIFSQLIALGALNNYILGSTAFTVNVPKAVSPVILESTKSPPEFEIFPTYESMDYIEAGNTVRTYPMPPWATRAQLRIESNGRPIKGEVNLWVGPLRKVHTLKFDNESGVEFPIETLIKFKKLAPVLKISTANNQNYPMKVGVFVPPPDRAAELEAYTEKTFFGASDEEKQVIQGSDTDGEYGMRCNWVIPANVESVQLLGWSKETGLKSFKVDVECLQGPNNIKQKYFLQCGGGSQPFHAVFQTPGSGWVIRIRNKKFVEDGKIQIAVVPYETSETPTGKKSVGWS
jgi:hypothetical protein